jgi:hypothetical protein
VASSEELELSEMLFSEELEISSAVPGTVS